MYKVLFIFAAEERNERDFLGCRRFPTLDDQEGVNREIGSVGNRGNLREINFGILPERSVPGHR